MSEFIIGKWQAETQIQDHHGEYTDIYLVEFVNEDTLKWKVESPYTEVNDKFHYEFLDDKTMSVENEKIRGGNWEVGKEGKKLLICIWSSDKCLLFTRIES